MDELQAHERFEMLVLDLLNSTRLLQPLVFGGGTMLRLCHGLKRYSVDLDFYLDNQFQGSPSHYLARLGDAMGRRFKITDQVEKRNTLLLEFAGADYPRRLKLEINKHRKIQHVEQEIAWSPFSSIQVLVNTVALPEMAAMKCEALLNRGEIRDAYDLEFLLRKGIPISGDTATMEKLLRTINAFRPVDFKVKLGSILESDQRQFYVKNGFKLLHDYLSNQL